MSARPDSSSGRADGSTASSIGKSTPHPLPPASSNYRRWIKIPMDSLSTAEARQLLIEAQLSTDRTASAVPPARSPAGRPEVAPTF